MSPFSLVLEKLLFTSGRLPPCARPEAGGRPGGPLSPCWALSSPDPGQPGPRSRGGICARPGTWHRVMCLGTGDAGKGNRSMCPGRTRPALPRVWSLGCLLGGLRSTMGAWPQGDPLVAPGVGFSGLPRLAAQRDLWLPKAPVGLSRGILEPVSSSGQDPSCSHSFCGDPGDRGRRAVLRGRAGPASAPRALPG